MLKSTCFSKRTLHVPGPLNPFWRNLRWCRSTGRPYIPVGSFLRFTRENDPSFEQTMRDFPLVIEVVNTGEIRSFGQGLPVCFITGLMPFLDELDPDTDPHC